MDSPGYITCDNCQSTFKQVNRYLSHVFECKPGNISAPMLSHQIKTVRVAYDERLLPGAKIETCMKGTVQSVEETDGDFLLAHIRVTEKTFKFV
jgi:hypothetical protein